MTFALSGTHQAMINRARTDSQTRWETRLGLTQGQTTATHYHGRNYADGGGDDVAVVVAAVETATTTVTVVDAVGFDDGHRLLLV